MMPSRLEPGGLERDHGGGVADLGVLPAHDAGEADGPVGGVADQEVVGGERALDVVERDDESRPRAARRTRNPPPPSVSKS